MGAAMWVLYLCWANFYSSRCYQLVEKKVKWKHNIGKKSCKQPICLFAIHIPHAGKLSGIIHSQLCNICNWTQLATPEHIQSYRHSTLLPYLTSLSCQCPKCKHSLTTGIQYHMAHAKDVQRYKNVTFHSEPVRIRLEKNSILRLNYCNMWGLRVLFISLSFLTYIGNVVIYKGHLKKGATHG